MGLAAEPKKLLSEKIVYCQAALNGRQMFAKFYSLKSLKTSLKKIILKENIYESI